MRAQRALFVSNLFPSSTEPGRGRFNLDQLRALRDMGLETTVVAPRLWFPGGRTPVTRAPFPPREEEIDGFRVVHPRALYVPLWRGALNGPLYGLSVLRACRTAAQTLAPDFLWAGFAFPDAVGADWVARRLRLPLVVSVHGSDVNILFRMRWRRQAMLTTFRRAVCVFSKSASMRDTIVEAGVDPARVLVVYNGVDRETFHPRPREAACRELGVEPKGRRALFVGNLVEIKGLPDLLEALGKLSATHSIPLELALVGAGPLEDRLRAQARTLGIESTLRFAGRQPRDRVGLWMAASDVLVQPSLDEGVPNVVLESLASGRPVVATRVGGVPEVHPGEAAGALVPPRDPAAFAAALERTLRQTWDPHSLAALVERFNWAESARQVLCAIQARIGPSRIDPGSSSERVGA